MKILMTADTIGGVWTYTLDLIRELGKHNIRILLATMGDLPTHAQAKEVLALPNVILRCSSYKLEWMPEPWDDVDKAQGWLLKLAYEFKPDVIHFNNYAFNALLFNVPVVVVAHSCVLSWWQAVKDTPIIPGWKHYSVTVKIALQSADVVVAPSETMMESIVKNYGPVQNQQIIHNARNNNIFKPGQKKKIIFAMGRLWDEAKNIQLLLEAADSLEYKIFIAGEHEEFTAGKRYPKNVCFLGKLKPKEIAEWLSIASIYVLPALYEPFGLSSLEAAHSGCVLILGRIPSLQEIWKDSALYCDTKKPAELVEKINMVMKDASVQRSFSRRAMQRASYFKVHDMAEAYIKLYNRLIEGVSIQIENEKMNMQ